MTPIPNPKSISKKTTLTSVENHMTKSILFTFQNFTQSASCMNSPLSDTTIIAASAHFGNGSNKVLITNTRSINRAAEKTPDIVDFVFMLLATIDLGGATADGKHLRNEDAKLHIP